MRWLAVIVVSVALGLGVALLVTDTTGPVAETPVDPYSVYDPIVAGEDFPGGIRWIVSRDGIRPVYEPQFVEPVRSGLGPEDLVIGVHLAGHAKAYPVGLMGAREMVNDWMGDIPTLVSWCPLCGTGTVHRRELDGAPVLFGNQGALWGNAMTWWDHVSGSIWSQPLGEAIAGPFEGEKLELLPSTLTTWSSWVETHPQTVVLDGPVYPSGTSLDQGAVVVAMGNQATAYPLTLVREAGVVNDAVADFEVAVVMDAPNGEHWSVFSRELDESIVTLVYDDDVLTDLETGSVWDPLTGAAIGGDLRGSRLQRLPSSTVFPEDFPTFWPTGVIYQP